MTNEQILKGAIEKAVKQGMPDTRVFERDTNCYYIIFSHSFAKAFWGDKKCMIKVPSNTTEWLWQYHLQTMVLELEPLQYIVKFL